MITLVLFDKTPQVHLLCIMCATCIGQTCGDLLQQWRQLVIVIAMIMQDY